MPAADRSRWAHSRSRELDPWREHDACGVGFVARASGQPFAVGSFFLPREHDALGRATAIIEEVLCREGLPVLGWRDVPVDLEVLGAGARASCPTIRQAVIAAPDGG